MKIIGIDPGLERVGYAVIKHQKNGDSLIESGLIETPARAADKERLGLIYKELRAVLERTTPSLAGVEALYFSKNIKTAVAVAESRGVILLLLDQQNVPVIEPTPLEVKMSLTGYGRAEKKQVGIMVQQILHLKTLLTPDDVSDAAAVALTVSAIQKYS